MEIFLSLFLSFVVLLFLVQNVVEEYFLFILNLIPIFLFIYCYFFIVQFTRLTNNFPILENLSIVGSIYSLAFILTNTPSMKNFFHSLLTILSAIISGILFNNLSEFSPFSIKYNIFLSTSIVIGMSSFILTYSNKKNTSK